MEITYKNQKGQFEPPVTVKYVADTLCPEQSADVLGCFCGGRVLELSQTLTEPCRLYPITFQNEEGRRIYERSLRFVVLLAVRRLFPDCHLKIEHSIGFGVYMVLLERALTKDDVKRVQAEMRQIVSDNLPFEPEHWSRQKAIDYFESVGENDKKRLLSYRPYDYFNVYRCGGMAEYFYGAMLPSTGYVKVFSMRHFGVGMIMEMPSPKNPGVPAPYIYRPKHMSIFAQSKQWCKILDCVSTADINGLIEQGRLREFIRVNEALHDSRIAQIAHRIREKRARAVFVAGPSSSGKTTFSNRLCIHLRVLGYRPILISLDDFYLNRCDIPPGENGEPDLEALDTLDIPLFNECIASLLDGRETALPRFDFKRGVRSETPHVIRLDGGQPVVIEGIHGLNPALHHAFDKNLLFRVFISELTCLNLDNHNRIRTTDARLLRRIVRDHQFRNTTPENTLSMWNSVRRGEEKWIFPYQEQADFVFNSALHYELPILKNYAYDMLKRIPPEDPNYFISRRLLKILHYFLPAPSDIIDEIPPLSLLREFIGGCTLYRGQ